MKPSTALHSLNFLPTYLLSRAVTTEFLILTGVPHDSVLGPLPTSPYSTSRSLHSYVSRGKELCCVNFIPVKYTHSDTKIIVKKANLFWPSNI